MASLLALRNLPSRYKGVLLDQFGVLHDGRRPYPGSIKALEYLHTHDMKIILLSNSSQRSKTAYGRLESLGFKKEWITNIITSGEMTHKYLLNRKGKFWEELGTKCLHFTWSDRGKIQLDDLDLEVVQDPNEAEFVLAHGTNALGRGDGLEPLSSSFEELKKLLKECTRRSKMPPMIVANPDFVTVDGSGLKVMPGSFGRVYEEMGGVVQYMGKPGPFIYTHALKVMQISKDQVVAIGDSMEHDIKGADDMGIDSVLVCGGIHKEELMNEGSEITKDAISELSKTYGVHPTFYIDSFRI